MKSKRIDIIIAIILVYLIFGFIFPNQRDSVYVGSEQFYEKAIMGNHNSLSEYAVSWVSKKILSGLVLYIIRLDSDGIMKIEDRLEGNIESVKYRVSPLGVVYKRGLIPYGVIVDKKLYTLYNGRIVYLNEVNESTIWENYNQSTDELMQSVT